MQHTCVSQSCTHPNMTDANFAENDAASYDPLLYKGNSWYNCIAQIRDRCDHTYHKRNRYYARQKIYIYFERAEYVQPEYMHQIYAEWRIRSVAQKCLHWLCRQPVFKVVQQTEHTHGKNRNAYWHSLEIIGAQLSVLCRKVYRKYVIYYYTYFGNISQ